MFATASLCRKILRAVVFLAAGCGEPELQTAAESAALASTQITYRGWDVWSGACTSSQKAIVYEPSLPGTYPVFVYAIGTGAAVTTAEGDLIACEMADRGFVAAVVSYSTLAGWSCEDMDAKADCTFSGQRAQSAVSVAHKSGTHFVRVSADEAERQRAAWERVDREALDPENDWSDV